MEEILKKNGPTISANPFTGRASVTQNGVTKILPTVKMKMGTSSQHGIKVMTLRKPIILNTELCQLTGGYVGTQEQEVSPIVGPGLVAVWIAPTELDNTRKCILSALD